MSVFLTVLSVLGAVVGGIFALVIIAFLAILPIKAEVDIGYNNEDKFLLRIKYFLFSYTFFPSKKKKKPENKQNEDETPASDGNQTDTDGKHEEKKQDKPPDHGKATKKKDNDGKNSDPEAENSDKKPEKSKENFFSKKAKQMGISDYITLLGYVKDMLGKIRFGDILINLIFGSDDASKTAMIYGTAPSAIFPLIGRIHNEKKAKYIDAHINADFASETTFADVYAEVYIRTIHAVALAAKALIYIMKIKENDNGRK
jgi:hypothetical protein